MAVPGHSPPPPPPLSGLGARSPPPGSFNGYGSGYPASSSSSPFTTRPMLPPSPSHHNSRFHFDAPSTTFSSSHDARASLPPPKRPSSSMSISSMLDGGARETEKQALEYYPNHTSHLSSRQSTTLGTLTNMSRTMSPPPRYGIKSAYPDYQGPPRSKTPDRIGAALGQGSARQRSASSSDAMQRPGPFEEPHGAMSTAPLPRGIPLPAWNSPVLDRTAEERARRTSLSGILQRPSSQPRPESVAHLADPFRNHRPASFEQVAPSSSHVESTRSKQTADVYDIRPPGLDRFSHPPASQISPTRGPVRPSSPDVPGSLSLGGSHGRGMAGILNGPTSSPAGIPQRPGPEKMVRQDSTQSQSDRSILGERGKFRAYSPFASSFTGGPVMLEEQGRKGSDELTQHRAILGLGADNKRGRYSPLPQAVQGAQAQSPVPDAGVKTEHGRVFSGIGSGISTTPTPGGPTSPFKRHDSPMRLSEDNLKNFSRTTPASSKRSRKMVDEGGAPDLEARQGDRSTNTGRKKGKFQHNYKVDLEEMAVQGFPRDPTAPLPGQGITSSATSTQIHSRGGQADTTGPYHQQHHSRPAMESPVFRPRKTIRVASVFDYAGRTPRRHLGTFTYRPTFTTVDVARPSNSDPFDVSITPNLLRSFSAPDQVNCTYTVRVPKVWLAARERALICAEQHLWGSGIYTDDSDPIAAAIHSGYIKTSLPTSVDSALLGQIVQEQNPTIIFPQSCQPPSQPAEIEIGQDLNITLLVLPLLDRYEGSSRFGVRSRSWPSDNMSMSRPLTAAGRSAPHDGVSFAVVKAEFVAVGKQEMKMGRSGCSRRARMQAELAARERDTHIKGPQVAHARRDQLPRAKLAGESGKKGLATITSTAIPRPVPATMATSTGGLESVRAVTAAA